MAIELIRDEYIWDSFVNESPDGVLFHKWNFLKIIEKHTNFKLLTYAVFLGKDKKLSCLFPIFYKKFKGINMIFSQPPTSGISFTSLVLSSNYYMLKQHQKESYLNKIVDELDVELKSYSPNFTSISLSPNLHETRPFKWKGYSLDPTYTYVIDLNRPIEDIWNQLDRDCRREIRNTDILNLSLEETNDINTFYNIMKDRYNQQGLSLPFASAQYFLEIIQNYPDYVKAYFLYKDDKLIDVLANYGYNKRLVFWKGFINLDRSVHSNEYLTWEFIKRAKSSGYSSLEIQGANIRRLCLFKSKFNPSLELKFDVYKKDALGVVAERIYDYLKRANISIPLR